MSESTLMVAVAVLFLGILILLAVLISERRKSAMYKYLADTAKKALDLYDQLSIPPQNWGDPLALRREIDQFASGPLAKFGNELERLWTSGFPAWAAAEHERLMTRWIQHTTVEDLQAGLGEMEHFFSCYGPDMSDAQRQALTEIYKSAVVNRYCGEISAALGVFQENPTREMFDRQYPYITELYTAFAHEMPERVPLELVDQIAEMTRFGVGNLKTGT